MALIWEGPMFLFKNNCVSVNATTKKEHMKTERIFAVLIAAAVLQTMSVSSQEDLFNVSFNGSVRPGEGNRAVAKLGNKGLIEQCVGTGFTAKEINQNFALVYNATADTIQVVNRADGSVVCDLFHFEGGTSTLDQGRLVRLAFVFTHDQADSIGSAVITETPKKNSSSGRPKVNGKIQFTLPIPVEVGVEPTDTTVTEEVTVTEETPTGNFIQATAVATATTDQQVGTGTFVVGSQFVTGEQAAANKAAKKNKNTGTTETGTTTENTETGTTTGDTGTSTLEQTTTNATQTATNTLGSTNSLGGMNTSILTLFPGNLTR
jgi:hypothetical protein